MNGPLNKEKEKQETEEKQCKDLTIKVGTQNQPHEVKELLELLQTYRHIFAVHPSELKTSNLVKHSIDTGSHPPIARPPYRQSPVKREHTQKLIRELRELSIIQPSASPWSSPVVIVSKKTGDLRFCVDYRKLNEITRRDQYSLPNIQDSLDYLGKAKYFSSLDLKSGYYQIEMSETDKQKTAFITTDGLYEFNVMPFGLTNAPATFQRCMDVVLSGLKYNSV